MYRITAFLTGLCFLLLYPVLLNGQGKNDYNIRLNAGTFIPPENTRDLTVKDALFEKSFYDGRHYLSLQFYALPDQEAKNRIKEAGIILTDYLPDFAYTASLPAVPDLTLLRSLNLRSVFQLTPEQKTVPAVLKGAFPAHAVRPGNEVDLTVVTYEKTDAITIKNSLLALDARILADAPMFRRFTIRVAQSRAKAIVALPFVQWVEFVDPPDQLENLPGRTLHRVNNLNDGVRNLQGEGINIGIWDGGAIGSHIDFLPASRLTQVEASAVSSHSTHCSGTILGRGLIDPAARGMAPKARLFSYNFNGNVQTEMATGIPLHNLVVSSHSYGSTQTCGLNGSGVTYSNRSRETDIVLNNFPFHLHCHSAGNDQTSCTGGWSTITSSGKSAKNNILVAAVTATDVMTGFSSFGPVQDGRVKPEISSFGSNVWSTVPNNSYGFNSGTSMATPGVSGSVALLVERYKQLNANILPPSALIKNIVLNGADDLGNPGPDYKFGYGRINALRAVRFLEENRYVLNNITTGSSNDISITVPAGAARLKVMLNWNDPAGAANANPALVNNLNLEVINGATTTLPWTLDPNNPDVIAVRGVDNISNIEQVTIDNPPPGNYVLRVSGFAVPTGPNQPYALTWNIDMPFIEVIYPNGNESLNPGSSETITWDQAGVTGPQTVQYSLNNGATWTTLSSTVPATTTRLSWSVPSGANTATALVRVSSGTLTDISDAPFKILGKPTGFSLAAVSGCSSGEIAFTWTALSSATHYDIYRLDPLTGEFVLLAADITGTTYSASGLAPGANLWFTIVAKNNTTGALSDRANAINGTVSSGGGGLGSIAGISGQAVVCGTATAVPYSIPPVTGATTYTWTAPPGASVASGQGTTSITINYPPGSTNGNVSVFAGNGSCNTPASILTITVAGAGIAAPTGGNNQSQTVCAGGSVPTLTATATVPANHTLLWYNAATGGSVVANPILATPGTVTYYAASRDNVSGCESNTRTAVTLTITQVSAAAISAGGNTTFCQGGNVVLTASPGSSYVWSTGATTQSITVNAAGSYTVTVTQSGGCVSTSPATLITVNPLPAASITAGGPLSFCQGNSVQLTASAGSAWLWSNGATTQSINVAASGSYSVTVTNASGCSAGSAATAVSVSPNPLVSISAAPYTRLYPGLNTTLSANVTPPGNYNYTWYNNGTVVTGAGSPTLPGIGLGNLGSYTVTVTNTTGLPCSNTSLPVQIADSATAKLFIYPSPNAGEFQAVYYTTGTNVKNTLVVFDAKGARVYSRTYTLNSPYQLMPVDMRHHSRGIYRVVLFNQAGKKMAAGAVVIQ